MELFEKRFGEVKIFPDIVAPKFSHLTFPTFFQNFFPGGSLRPTQHIGPLRGGGLEEGSRGTLGPPGRGGPGAGTAPGKILKIKARKRPKTALKWSNFEKKFQIIFQNVANFSCVILFLDQFVKK